MLIVVNVRKLNEKQAGYEGCLATALAVLDSQTPLIWLSDRRFHSVESFPQHEVEVMPPAADNPITRSFWFGRRLPSFLKKKGADLLLSMEERCLLSSNVQQMVTVLNRGGVKRSSFKYLQKADGIIAGSDYVKHMLTGNGINASKIYVAYPFAKSFFKPLTAAEKNQTREKYSESKEFFFCVTETGEPVNILKAFSYFKKRQRSGMKLLLTGNSKDRVLSESLQTYKYREDVTVLRQIDEEERAALMASAYATLHPDISEEAIITLIEAMQCGVPAIIRPGAIAKEIAYDDIPLAEINDPVELGNKMMRLYTDEQLRSKLIERGIEKAKQFSPEKTAAVLWQAIDELT